MTSRCSEVSHLDQFRSSHQRQVRRNDHSLGRFAGRSQEKMSRRFSVRIHDYLSNILEQQHQMILV
jgi:hypothetical protein